MTINLRYSLIILISIFIQSIALAQTAKLIKCGRLIDIENERILENIMITVDGKMISNVGKNLEANGREVIDLSTYTVLPGLIDAHTHLLLQGDSTHVAYNDQILKESIPYQKYIAGKKDEIQIFELFKLFGFESHTPQQDIEKRFKDLKRISEEIEDEELENFISFARKIII